jgi:hypothetical protein
MPPTVRLHQQKRLSGLDQVAQAPPQSRFLQRSP